MSSQHLWKRSMLASKAVIALAFALAIPVHAQDNGADISQKLQGFDAFMEKTLKDWNAPGG